MRTRHYLVFLILAVGLGAQTPGAQDLMQNLGQFHDFLSRRVSSYDRSGGNNDRISIPPGETAVLAEIPGPAAIHHIWVTIAAEAFYGRKIILRMYWDEEDEPSVEAPIGDFFGVGHGLNRDFSSMAIACSSLGRARNCYWFMPFHRSARITVTNQGRDEVGAFYYYIDYRSLPESDTAIPYFHAQYRQEMPCTSGANYVILEAAGRGHYVGCNLSILQRAMGWWGEGDDMILVDGEEKPSLHGTGSEDYFSDAWGMREDENLFYGCPLQEADFKAGAKATVYRHHIADPIPFRHSIQVSIEHGHANDRSDFFSSVAYWYQAEPHAAFPPLPPAADRLPFALETPEFRPPQWKEIPAAEGSAFFDEASGTAVSALRLTVFQTSFYDPQGTRFPVVSTDQAEVGDELGVALEADADDIYDIRLFFLKGPNGGDIRPARIQRGSATESLCAPLISGFAREQGIAQVTLSDVRLQEGLNRLIFQVTGKAPEAGSRDFGWVGMSLSPSRPHFIREWNLIGPFDAPDMSYLQAAYPPERGIDLAGTYQGKDGRAIGWKRISAPESGWVKLEDMLDPNEQAVAYASAHIHTPEALDTHLLIGSDDGVRIWLNGRLVHSHPAYRGAYPDQDRIEVRLHSGWNHLLIKVLQGAGGWGFFARFADPDRTLVYAAERR